MRTRRGTVIALIIGFTMLASETSEAQTEIVGEVGFRVGYVFGEGFAVGFSLGAGLLVASVNAAADVLIFKTHQGSPPIGPFRLHIYPEVTLPFSCPVVFASLGGGPTWVAGQPEGPQFGWDFTSTAAMIPFDPSPQYIDSGNNQTIMGVYHRYTSRRKTNGWHELGLSARKLATRLGSWCGGN